MSQWIQIIAVILAGVAVAVADALIKHSAGQRSFVGMLKDPIMVAVYALYLVQIIFFLYVFYAKWNLAHVGILQMVAYTVTILATGVLVFGESFTGIQIAGICVAIFGLVLMNI